MSTVTTDLTIFKTYNNQSIEQCSNDNDSDIIEGCDALKRLITALKYYSKFDLIKNQNDQNIFSDFIFNIYGNLINDYIHLIDHHSNQIQQISELLEKDGNLFKCDFKTCKYTTRHYKRDHIQNDNDHDDKKQNQNDKLLNFYVTTIDSLHFYLLHLFDSGMRIKRPKNEKKQQEEEMEEERHDSEKFDIEFSKMCQQIKQRRSIRKSFDRFKSDQKFTISTSKQQTSTSTFILDDLFKHLSSIKTVSEASVSRLFKYIKDHQYDTESVEIDVNAKSDGYIANHLKNEEIMKEIMNFFKTLKSMYGRFGICLRCCFVYSLSYIRMIYSQKSNVFSRFYFLLLGFLQTYGQISPITIL